MHVYHQHAPSGHTRKCKVDRLYTHATEHCTIHFKSVIIALFVLILARDTVPVSTAPRPSFTFAPVARSSPSPPASSHSSSICSCHTVATLRSTLDEGLHELLRLVPTVMVMRVLPACLSRLRHPCRSPCRDGFATRDTSRSVKFR